jgi:hypothetical protein
VTRPEVGPSVPDATPYHNAEGYGPPVDEERLKRAAAALREKTEEEDRLSQKVSVVNGNEPQEIVIRIKVER